MNEAAEPPSLSRGLALFLSILLLGVLLRLYHLGTASLWWDEANTMHYSRWVLDPAKIFDTAYLNEAPLLPLLTALWNGLFNLVSDAPAASALRDWWLRLLPFIASAGCMPLLYLVTRRLAGHAPALVATLLLAISPFHVHYAQELRVYSLHCVTGLAACYCMLRALDGGRWPWWLAMVLCEALLFYGHYVSVWVIFCFNLWFVLQWPLLQRHFLRWTAWHLLLMLLIAPGLYHAWRCNQHLLQIEYTWYPTPTLRSLVITFKNFLAGYGPSAWAYRPLLLLAALLCAVGVWRLRGQWRSLSFLLVLGLGPIALNFFMWRARDFSLYEDRLFILSAALLCALAAIGAMALRPKLLSRGALLLFVALTLPGLWDYYRGALHPVREHRLAICDKPDFRTAATFLAEHWQEGDLLAHDSLFTLFPMRYYFPGNQAHLGATPEDYAIYAKAFGNVPQLEHLGAMPVLAEQAVHGASRIWYIEARGVTADDVPQTESIGAWLAKRYHAAESHDLAGLRLVLFTKEAT